MGDKKGDQNQAKNGEGKIGVIKNIGKNKNAGAQDARELEKNGFGEFIM